MTPNFNIQLPASLEATMDRQIAQPEIIVKGGRFLIRHFDCNQRSLGLQIACVIQFL